MRITDLEVTHADARVNGTRLHYVEKGSGPLVVLLHGFPETWWTWRYQIDPLVRAGYRVIAPDLRGYSTSDRHGPYDLDTLATDVRELIAHAGAERAALVAHDWGGAIAWHLAATQPAACERLAVLNCPHPAVMREALMHRWSQVKRSWYMAFFQLPWLPERVLTRRDAAAIRRAYRGMAVDRANFSDAEIAPFAAAIQLPGAATAALGYYRAAFASALRPPVGYAPIAAPALLLWALGDKALGYADVVPGTERFAPALRIATLADCGHFVQAEQPAWVNARLIEFLGEKPAT